MLSEQLKQLQGSPTAKFFRLAKEREAQGHDIIHLEIGQPDFQPLPPIVNATIEAINQGKTTYAISSGIPELREKIASVYSEDYSIELNPNEEIIVTSGAKQSILASIYALLNRGDKILFPEPYWVSYPDMTRLSGGQFLTVPMQEDFSLNKESIKEILSNTQVKVLLLNSPNNPTGHILSSSELSFVKDLIEDANLMIIADEIYNDYMYIPSSFKTILTELKNWRENIIVVNGFSKTYSMTGFRLGYSIANKSLSQGILRFIQASTSCATTFCQWGAVTALKHRFDAQKVIEDVFPARRQLLLDEVSTIDGLSLDSVDGAFYGFIRYSHSDKPSELVVEEILNHANVATIPGTAFGDSADGYFRVAFSRSEEEITEAFKRIREYTG
ncbi:MAG: pyridoxal phosphate-dependent aminotransferase [Candidatus Hodarchaeales archaeon]|jgi:aspartate/methionine/tyrosine aminotransferase